MLLNDNFKLIDTYSFKYLLKLSIILLVILVWMSLDNSLVILVIDESLSGFINLILPLLSWIILIIKFKNSTN